MSYFQTDDELPSECEQILKSLGVTRFSVKYREWPDRKPSGDVDGYCCYLEAEIPADGDRPTRYLNFFLKERYTGTDLTSYRFSAHFGEHHDGAYGKTIVRFCQPWNRAAHAHYMQKAGESEPEDHLSQAKVTVVVESETVQIASLSMTQFLKFVHQGHTNKDKYEIHIDS